VYRRSYLIGGRRWFARRSVFGYLKTLRGPNTKIVAVEAVRERRELFAPRLKQANEPSSRWRPTLADGLADPQVGTNTFRLRARLVDLVVTVTEETKSPSRSGSGTKLEKSGG